MKAVDCRVFEDQLDALARGELREDGARLLRLHAAGCPECAALLAVKEELRPPSLEELEAAVPPEILATVWPGVKKGLDRDGTGSATVGSPASRPRFRLLVPLLAAASLLLLFSTGLLVRELERSRSRETALALELEHRDGGGTTPGGGRSILGAGDPLDLLGAEGEITVAELRALLDRLPAGTTVLTARQAQLLVGALRLRVPGVWREARASLGEGSIRAEELLELLDRIDLPEEQALPAARIRDLLS